jgi:hypothetical protein
LVWGSFEGRLGGRGRNCPNQISIVTRYGSYVNGFRTITISSSEGKSLQRAETRGEAALPSPQPSKAWMGGASGGLVCVERTLLSAASDSCPEKREQARSNRTGRRRRPRPPFAKYAKDGAPTAWLCLRDQKPGPAPLSRRESPDDGGCGIPPFTNRRVWHPQATSRKAREVAHPSLPLYCQLAPHITIYPP